MKLLLALLLFSLPAPAAFACEVPVCDVAARISEMRKMAQAPRAEALRRLREEHRRTTDLKVLANLRDFSDAARELFLELKEEDWLLREANYLGDLARTGLLKYERPELGALKTNFDGIRESASRYTALNHWSEHAKSLTDLGALRALLSFGAYAKAWAESSNQEDYFAREADKLVQAAGKTLTLLYPAHEGTYALRVRCEPAPHDCPGFLHQMDVLTVLEGLTGRGLVVGLSGSSMQIPYYVFYNSLLDSAAGTIRGGDAPSWVRPSDIQLTFNAEAGTIAGTLYDTSYPGVIRLEGKALRRAVQYYQAGALPKPVPTEMAEGDFRGRLGDMAGVLSVKRYGADRWTATFATGAGLLTKAFQGGVYNPSLGVLTFLNVAANGRTDAKLVLALDPQKRAWRGFLMFSSGRPLDADFVKSGERRRP